MNTSRTFLVAAALAASALLAGCATNTAPGGAASPSTPVATPTAKPAPDDPSQTQPKAIEDEPAAYWVDGGNAFVVVSYGSGSCVPVSQGVEANGQNIVATLQTTQQACTMDYAPRVSYVAAPEGVDPTKPATVDATIDKVSAQLELTPIDERNESSAPRPSATALTPSSVAIISWGSSTCRPAVEEVAKETPASATVLFRAPEGTCTADLAPRATLIYSTIVKPGAELTLTGLDGASESVTVTVENRAG